MRTGSKGMGSGVLGLIVESLRAGDEKPNVESYRLGGC